MKNKIFIMIVTLISSIAILFAAISIITLLTLPLYAQILIGIFGGILFVANLTAVALIDYSLGEYECRKCGHHFKPSFWAYFIATHFPNARRLKCPECQKRSFCKRKIK